MLVRFFIGCLGAWLGVNTMAIASDLPVNSQVQFKQAQQAYETKNWDQAESLWLALEKSAPTSLSIQNNLAAIDIQKQRYAQAKVRLTKALNSDPELTFLFENLNQIYAYEAQQAYQKVFKNTQVENPHPKLMYQLHPLDLDKFEKQKQQVLLQQEQALQVIEGWRLAWQEKNVGAYLKFYIANYATDDMAHDDWVSSRTGSLTRPDYIKVQLENIVILPISSESIRVSFSQQYDSDRFKDQTNKVLYLSLSSGKMKTWQISQELVSK